MLTMEEKKSAILALPEGTPKPRIGVDPYAYTMRDLIRQGSPAYDADFHKALQDRFPNWFHRTNLPANVHKDYLLNLPLKSDRPELPDRHAVALRKFTNPSTKFYDGAFTQAIMTRQPQWFQDTTWTDVHRDIERKKSEILLMPEGTTRPHTRNHPLGHALLSYTSGYSQFYDADFAARVRKQFPHWFTAHQVTEERRVELLAIPAGSPRPSISTKLGKLLATYVTASSGSYSREFDQIIREKQPQWFNKKRRSSILP